MFYRLKAPPRTGARPFQDTNIVRVSGWAFPPTSRGFGKGTLSLQNPSPAHTEGRGHGKHLRHVAAIPKGQGLGHGARHSPDTCPVALGLQPPQEEQGRCLGGAAIFSPQGLEWATELRGPDHGCKYTSTAAKHSLREAPVSVTGG